MTKDQLYSLGLNLNNNNQKKQIGKKHNDLATRYGFSKQDHLRRRRHRRRMRNHFNIWRRGEQASM